MKRFLLIMAVCVSSIGLVWAQNQTISGKVIDAATEEPVIGASVVVVGTSDGTITDVDGQFTISVAQGAKLAVSFIGLKTVEVEAKDGMVVTLAENTSELDEVMVVAFGTTTKKSYTGSASVVKSEDITKRQTSNVSNSLAGQVAGVQGLSSSGQPGEVSTIRIRGIGSMNASNAPLYVIDGIPADDDMVSTLANSDIESVTVLKDAASNALYGARGANGVILVTTKRGSTKDARISIDAKWGTNQRAVPNYNVMTDPAMYYETFYKALYNGQVNAKGADYANEYANTYLLDAANGGLGYQVYTVPEGERLIGTNGKLNPNATLGYVNEYGYTLMPDNWYNELFNNNNFRQEYNLNISGSADKLTYYASASYLDDSGIIQNSGFQRFTARTNVDYQAKKWLKIGTNMNYSHADQKYPEESEYGSYSSGNIFYLSNYMAPIYPLYIRDAEGKVMTDANGYTMYDYGDATINGATRAFMNQANPASAIQLDKELYKKDLFNGKWYVAVEPYKGLKATANIGVSYNGTRYQTTANPYYGQFASSGGYASVQQSRTIAVDQQYLLTYNDKFDDHTIDALVGYENYMYQYSYVYGSQNKLYNPDIAEVSNAILSPSTGSATTNYRTQSILAQLKWSYGERYYASASYSRMATSRFAADKRWGNFWSIGAAWDIKGEPWMQSAENVNQLKLKISYGAQGNDNLGNNYAYIDQYTISENNGAFATTLAYKGNKDLTWETSYNFNLGLDFSFFKERLSGTVEFWNRKTDDQLYYQPVPSSLGYSYLPVNIGSVDNTGVDLEIKGDIIKTRNVTWGLYLNGTYFKNKILSMSPELNGQWINGSYIYKVGGSLYNYYTRKYAGVDQTNGAALWYKDVTDANGNVVQTTTSSYSDATKYEIGDILPKVYGGFGTTLDVYGVDISVAFNYQLGGKIYDTNYANLMHSGSSSDAGQNWHMDILNAWTPENTNTTVPALNAQEEYANGASDRWLTSSDYLSLQNITIGYSFPSKWMKKIKMEKIRIYAVADNVALFSARQGLDPRVSFSSSAGLNYTAMRTISAGLNIVF